MLRCELYCRIVQSGFYRTKFYRKILNLLNILPYCRKYCSNPGGRISRRAYRVIDFSFAAKRRNIGIPSIIPIVFPLITGKLNIVSVHTWIRKFTNIRRPLHFLINPKLEIFSRNDFDMIRTRIISSTNISTHFTKQISAVRNSKEQTFGF